MNVHVTSGVTTTAALLVVGLVVAVSEQGQASQQQQQQQQLQRKALRSGQLSGFVYSDSFLFQQDAESRIRCAGLCSLDEGCRTFTFTTTVSAGRGVCRGHSELMTAQNTRTTSDETAFYVIRENADWLDTPCTVDGANCTAINSACYLGKCACTAGYYYSLTLNLCTSSCSLSDLQATFRKYQGARIKACNTAVTYSSVTDCQQACVQHPRCRTIEHKASSAMCHLSNCTALDVPLKWEPGKPDFDFFQRDCA